MLHAKGADERAAGREHEREENPAGAARPIADRRDYQPGRVGRDDQRRLENRLQPGKEAERTRGDEQVQDGIGTGRVIARHDDRFDQQGPERKGDVHRPARWAGAEERWRQRGHKKA